MSETYTIKMPQLSDTMTEGVVVSWEKNIGDKIERGTIVATVETDKAIMDVEVFKEGYLSGPLAPVDSTVAVGDAIAYLVASANEVQDAGAAAPAAAASAPRSASASGTTGAALSGTADTASAARAAGRRSAGTARPSRSAGGDRG